MKNTIFASVFAVTVSLSLTHSALSQDVISDVKTAVVAEKADIPAVVKAAAEANPTQAAEIAQAAIIALVLKSNDSADEATIESIIQAAIEGSKADADFAKSIRTVAESALLQPDDNSQPIQGGATVGFNPLDFPGIDPRSSPLSSFNMGGGAGGTTGAGGGIGGGGIGSLLGGLPAGGLPGGFFGATPGGGGDGPGASGDLGGGSGNGGGLVNPPVTTRINPVGFPIPPSGPPGPPNPPRP